MMSKKQPNTFIFPISNKSGIRLILEIINVVLKKLLSLHKTKTHEPFQKRSTEHKPKKQNTFCFFYEDKLRVK